jgi:hypothetical protein
VDWGRIFFALHYYCHLSESEIKRLSLPKLKVYLGQIKLQMEYEIRLHGLEVKDEYIRQKKATVSDIKNFFSWINAAR